MNVSIAVLMAVLLQVQPKLDKERAAHLAAAFVEIGKAQKLDPYFLAAVAWVETGRTFRGDLKSHAGACGLMQVIPKFQPDRVTCAQLQRDDRLSVEVGAKAMLRWRRYETRHCKKGHDYAAHYNSGTRTYRRSRLYARTVRKRASAMRAAGKRVK